MSNPYRLLSLLLSTLSCRPAPDASITRRLDSLGTEIDSVKSKVASLEWDKLIADLDEVALLKPADTGYDILKTDYGTITVSLENVVAYANGSRVTLKFGNTTSARINDASATLTWGRADTKGNPDHSTSRSREVSFTKSIDAGSWSRLSVVLDGIPPTELGFVRVTNFINKGIGLSQ